VVITGIGAVTPFGRGVEAMMAGLRAGRSAVRLMPEWAQYDGLRCRLAAPCELRDEKAIPRQFRRSMSPLSIMAAQAADEALADAGIDKESLTDGRCGCVMGSTGGSAITINEAFEQLLPGRDFSRITAMMFFKSMAHTAAANLAQYLGLHGTVMATCAACASSLQAIGAAADLIRLGRQDLVLCGGAEEVHPTVTGIFDLLFATSTGFNDRPDETPRPFDARRDGLVCAEGAGVLILESLSRARRRGARILAEVVGYHTCASGDHLSQSSRSAMAACMTEALRQADLRPADIAYVNAHATGTLQGDAEEAAAIAAIFGDRIPVSSLKGHLGHTLGASGAIELIATLRMQAENCLLPGRNLVSPDDDCRGIRHLAAPLPGPVPAFLKNNFAFGGVNASLVCQADGTKISAWDR
jgi:3-oxoacyl-[acyl-carrier-protein] synthase II